MSSIAAQEWIETMQKNHSTCGCGCGGVIIFTMRQYHHRKDRIDNIYYLKNHASKSEANRIKNSERQKGTRIGKDNHFYGKHHTPEVIKANSVWHKGRLVGELNPFYGKTQPLEVRKKSAEYNRIHNTGRPGHPCTEATKKILSEKATKQIAEGRVGKNNKIVCYYKTPYQGKRLLRSSYEIGFALLLDELAIPWLHEAVTFKLSNGRHYTPDFYLPQHSIVIDTKGMLEQQGKDKIKMFQNEYPDVYFKLLYASDLKNMNVTIGHKVEQLVENSSNFLGWPTFDINRNINKFFKYCWE